MILIPIAALLVSCGGSETTADRILDQLPEGGPPVTADRCVLFGAADGLDVYRCFNDDLSPRSVGCFALGHWDNVIQYECPRVTRSGD